MERRTFMGMMGAGLTGAAAGADSPPPTRYVTVQRFFMKNGTQVGRLHDYLSKGLLPKSANARTLILEALVAAHMPQVAVVTEHGRDELLSAAETASVDDTFRAWEEGSEQPYEWMSKSVLRLTNYSPTFQGATEKPKTPRVFELRVYHSPTQRQLAALNDRFAGPEIKIFHRSGIHPVFYSTTLFGDDMPNLTYLIPFPSLADREKAWAAFGADPEWVKVRAESIAKYGQISSVQNMSLFRATAYSPIQ
jgi:hypothetical protein